MDDDDDEDDDESVEGIPYKYEGGVQPMQLVEEKKRERINHVTDKLRSLSLSTDKLTLSVSYSSNQESWEEGYCIKDVVT